MNGSGRRRTGAALGVCALLGGALLAGCGQSGSGSSSGAAAGVNRAQAAAPAAGDAAAGNTGNTGNTSPGGSTGSGGSAGSGGGTAVPAARDLVYTGEVQLRSGGVDAAVTEAEGLVSGVGGYIDSEQAGPVDELGLTQYQDPQNEDQDGSASPSADSSLPVQVLPEPSDIGGEAAQLVVRVPSASFDAVYRKLQGLGTVLGQERSTQDVTEQVIDVASRLKTQEASVDRVRALMNQATDMTDVIALEAALTQRESDLETLEAQQAALQSQTAMSTVTLQVYQQAAAVAPVAKPKPRDFGSAMVDALKDGVHGLYLVFRTLVVCVAAVLPFAVVLVPLGWLCLWLNRRLRPRLRRPAAAPVVQEGPPSE
ncbi:DUF4349 domain-containing protein [Streptacidiphilus albus]|uniref:DUF4349 domain-containing protein n=1 Tax=Streptacidiphilus albus TaxID=105425 RepID=UPI0009DEEE21|nr:DUF4349 domain-containing protein [Streptacidiphilus albus]